MSSRRNFLKTLAGVSSGALYAGRVWSDVPMLGPDNLPAGATASAVLASLPGKETLIKRTYRPPNYESPLRCFDDFYTPNKLFFVRYHLAAIPQVALAQWKLKIGGDAVGAPQEFTLDQLQRNFETVEVPAVCLCAGNRRGLLQPHVPGIQWGHGAMGNALWRGIRLRDLLGKVGLKKDALEIAFDGADSGVLEKTPDFIKSLPLTKALDEHTVIAFAMNGEPLPHWNGFPARLVVPGWAATYWIKHLSAINVVSRPLDSFWMNTAYRLPKGRFAVGGPFPSQETETSVPITELVVNSLIVSPEAGQTIKSGHPIDVSGIAWDGGHGIERVEVSIDGGQSWRLAQLDQDHGRFTWRRWSYRFDPTRQGDSTVMVRATNRIGQMQVPEPIPNPAGYHHNAVQSVTVHVV